MFTCEIKDFVYKQTCTHVHTKGLRLKGYLIIILKVYETKVTTKDKYNVTKEFEIDRIRMGMEFVLSHTFPTKTLSLTSI